MGQKWSGRCAGTVARRNTRAPRFEFTKELPRGEAEPHPEPEGFGAEQMRQGQEGAKDCSETKLPAAPVVQIGAVITHRD